MRLVLIVLACATVSGCVGDGSPADVARNADEQSLFNNYRLSVGSQVETARSVLWPGADKAPAAVPARSTP